MRIKVSVSPGTIYFLINQGVPKIHFFIPGRHGGRPPAPDLSHNVSRLPDVLNEPDRRAERSRARAKCGEARAPQATAGSAERSRQPVLCDVAEPAQDAPLAFNLGKLISLQFLLAFSQIFHEFECLWNS